MEPITRADVMRKCIILFEALKRVASKGGAGLEPAPGADEEFWMDSECLNVLRHMLKEMEAGKKENKDLDDELKKQLEEFSRWKNWQLDMRDGPPERLEF